MKYESEIKCPCIKVQEKNINYAKLLLEDYAGSTSEETAIHLYIYEHIVTEDRLKEYSEALASIARVEMHHLKILGKLIKLLGLKPVYGSFSNNNNFKPWSGLFVDYSIDLKSMLESDIKRETKAIQKYKLHRSLINDKYIKEILTKIIQDEEIHLSIFNKFYQELVN